MATGKVSPAISARVVPVASAGSTLPAWAAAIAPGTWGVASVGPNDLFNDVDSGLSGSDFEEIIQNYNGGAACPPGSTAYPDGALLLWGGGHSNTGQDTSLVALNLTNRQFELVEGPSAGPYSSGINAYPTGRFADGKPVPTHTYHYPAFDPVNELFFVPRGVSGYGTTSSTQTYRLSIAHIYDLAANTWRVGPSNPTLDQYGAGGWSVWDDRRSCIWTRPRLGIPTAIVKYESLNVLSGGEYGTETNYTYSDSSYTETDAVFLRHPSDADKDLIVYGQFSTTFALRCVPFASNVPQARATLTVGGFPPVYRKDASMMWSKRRGSILYYSNGEPNTSLGGTMIVHELVPPSDPNNWRTGTWTWRIITDPANTVTPPRHTDFGIAGLYSKARLFAYDDGEIIVAVTSHTQPAHAFRVP
jgi:hypothetical protein